MGLKEGPETEAPRVMTLADIKTLPELAGAFYVEESEQVWWVRFRIIREQRADKSEAKHPQISASDGKGRVSLILSKRHGWHIQAHQGNFKFNRRVLKYLNGGEVSLEKSVEGVLGEDF